MANPYPARFEDARGNTRLEGVIDFTDTANQPGGGVTAREFFEGSVSVPSGANTNVPFTHTSGDALLDYTDPERPAIVTSGVYALTVLGAVPPSASAALSLLDLVLDPGGAFTEILDQRHFDAGSAQTITFTPTYYLDAGMTILLFAFQATGAPLTYGANTGTYIQRIT